MISRDLWNRWLRNQDMIDCLDSLDIDLSSKLEIFDVLDINMTGEIRIPDIVSGLMRLRGVVSKNDIVAVRLKVRYITKLIEDIWKKSSQDGEQINKLISAMPQLYSLGIRAEGNDDDHGQVHRGHKRHSHSSGDHHHRKRDGHVNREHSAD